MDFYTYSNIGKREINEDCCGVSTYNDSFCFVVADGLGGHGGGDVASKNAVSEVCRLFLEQGFSDSFFEKAFGNAQKAILEKQAISDSWDRMKTTLVIIVVDNGYVHYAHIGDSRAYYFKNNKYKLHSIDHSVPQMLAISGDISEKEIRFHPDRNRLMRVMGVKGEEPQYTVGKKIKLSGKQAFLLCTDGFWELIDEDAMSKCLSLSSSSKDWVEKMSEIIESNGKNTKMDNYTCIAFISEKKGLFGGLI